jgi:membrane fusion protein, copper/silver efflux system
MKTLLTILMLALLASCSKPAVSDRRVKFYQSPMHPWITSDKPGKCTICGMDLVPVYEGQPGASADQKVISLSEASQHALDVATTPVRRINLTKSLRFSGVLEDDDNLHRVIAAFYNGRIDQVYVQHVGQYVQKGQPLAAIYSPELLYILREFQSAVRGKNDAIARNAAQRLVQYGLSAEQVQSLGTQSENVFTIQLLAPITGTILTKTAYQGQYIKTGEPLFEMGDLARLWFHAEVYERDLSDIRLGQVANLTTPSVPGREFKGVVTFIDPNFDEKTRSTKVRIEVDNPLAEGDNSGLRRLLPHRAYAEATLKAGLGSLLVIPRTALLQDGRRSVVYVEQSAGHYEPRVVRIGRTGDEGVEILDGLKDGDRVVTQGNLMLDAEAQLRHLGESSDVPTVAATTPASAEAQAFLKQLSEVSAALARDDSVAAIMAGQNLPALAEKIPSASEFQGLKVSPGGSDLKALRQSFLPWSQAGAKLALDLQQAGQDAGVRVFECPMTGDSFPGAPNNARWVQQGASANNPYFGPAMLTCGAEVKP